MDENFDLFGHPCRPGYGSRGRPPYEATERDRNKIKLLLALGWTIPRLANAIDVSPATVKRHFRAELKVRDAMRDRLEARRIELAMEQANLGNIAALKELGKMIERNDMMNTHLAHHAPEKPAKEPKLGKKEQALLRAKAPDTGTTLGDLMAQRQMSIEPKLN